jgi:type VI secretion system secreted protein VgrG
MSLIQLAFESGESSLSVRSFEIHEEISQLFRIELMVRGQDADIDLDALIGQVTTLRLPNGPLLGMAMARTWSGVTARCEQVRVETDGVSTYELTIVPRLWLLQKRKNHRLFQHVSVVEIVSSLMREWGIASRWVIDPKAYPPLELRVQYGESDYHFMSRLLEEAGISFHFASDDDQGSVLVFSDEPHAAEQRLPIAYSDSPGQLESMGKEYVTGVRLRREIRPGRVVLRDFDFRKPRYELVGHATAAPGVEDKLEQFHYMPGQFITEGHRPTDTPTADDLGVARADQHAGMNLATRLLDAERTRRRTLTFASNCFDLAPGVTMSISGHPRSDINVTSKLLMIGLTLRGEVGKADEWVAEGRAVYTDIPFRPALVTPKPTSHGVQSAIVVGPTEETVYTDEFGRVRVQFHWDRQGQFDPNSSCWMRVSQGWAGPGYGLFNLPRVGHEVLVGFVEGDPDQPIIVGRVFNGAQKVPYPLPGSKLMSGWKTDSNSNIILFDDTPGDEMFYEQAEKDRLGIVKNHEAYITGGRRTTWIGTTDKTFIRTSGTRVALGTQNTICGISNKHVAGIGFSVEAGFGAKLRAGRTFKASVQPVLPLITAMMEVNDAKAQIISKLPGGVAPDLQMMLPAYAGGPPPASPDIIEAPAMSEAELEKELTKTLTVVAKAIEDFEPEEVEELAEAKDLDHAMTQMLASLEKKGGKQAVVALADATVLSKKLETMKKAAAAMSGSSAPKQTGMFEKLIMAILALIVPETKIEIKHQKILIATEKASIELKKDDIKMKAKGDIEIKADGDIKIEGASVSISPTNCKCG